METTGAVPQGSVDVDEAVRSRYSTAAKEAEAELCCPVDYDPRYLAIIPQEILERDYGCGDPSRYVGEGDVVLDLGSGGGKICYIAAQVVGSSGRVIGVDCNEEMLSLARKYEEEIGERLGYRNVEFRKGRIQDLALDLEAVDRHLQQQPVASSGDWFDLEAFVREQRSSNPLIDDESVDVVVSNCVLNLVRESDRRQLFGEIHRVLKRGGRAVISDIVCDEDVPEALKQDGTLWSGCLSGAYREDRFVAAFEEAGFYGMEVLSRQEEPWAVLDGIEFRSLTVRAWKGKEGPCLERNQAVIYEGPWKAVIDDDGHRLERGQRMAVCDKTFQIYTREPYARQVTPVPPRQDVPLEEAGPFACDGDRRRPPRETKGNSPLPLVLPNDDGCGDSSDCC